MQSSSPHTAYPPQNWVFKAYDTPLSAKCPEPSGILLEASYSLPKRYPCINFPTTTGPTASSAALSYIFINTPKGDQKVCFYTDFHCPPQKSKLIAEIMGGSGREAVCEGVVSKTSGEQKAARSALLIPAKDKCGDYMNGAAEEFLERLKTGFKAGVTMDKRIIEDVVTELKKVEAESEINGAEGKEVDGETEAEEKNM